MARVVRTTFTRHCEFDCSRGPKQLKLFSLELWVQYGALHSVSSSRDACRQVRDTRRRLTPEPMVRLIELTASNSRRGVTCAILQTFSLVDLPTFDQLLYHGFCGPRGFANHGAQVTLNPPSPLVRPGPPPSCRNFGVAIGKAIQQLLGHESEQIRPPEQLNCPYWQGITHSHHTGPSKARRH